MILYGNKLVEKIREEFDKAENRIYIAVPFIGDWNAITGIMGSRWTTKASLKIKILTDIRNDGFINGKTMRQFLKRGEARTLAGLHAKIYIIDNSVFITSANLTSTAFTKRYEICYFFNIAGQHEITDVFEKWWEIADTIDATWEMPGGNGDFESETGNTSGLKKLWNMPKRDIRESNFRNYPNDIALYKDFLEIYLNDGVRLLPNLHVYQELDAFLNFLFHEDIDKPSYEYLEKKHRILSDDDRLSETRKYKKRFKIFTDKNPDFDKYREKRIDLIQRKLSMQEIERLDRKSLAEIAGVFHTMNSLALNKVRFLNPDNNNLKTIRSAFRMFLHGKDPIEVRMERCNKSLKYFGRSSIKELAAWYYPDQYPTMNRNTNSGLKFFGYDIKTY